MLICINKKSPEYQALKEKSGIPEFKLEAYCRSFMEKYDRFPNLDELPEVNSELHLRDRLNVSRSNSVEIELLLLNTGSESIELANHKINDEYRDLEVEIVPIVNDAIVDITHRPTTNDFSEDLVIVDEKPNNFLVFSNALDKLSNLYGIKFNVVTDLELNTDKWKELISDVGHTNAFIYNNEIYINVDRHSVDAPIHEIMHLLVGSMRFTNPLLYELLISSVEEFPNYNLLSRDYINKSRNDINEEIFVSEAAKFLSGLSSNITDLKIQYELSYNVKRLLDSILMGKDSVKTISDNRLFNMSLKLITKEVRSTIMTNNFKGTINVEGSALHRKLNNIKSDLIKLNLLLEVCD